MASGKKTAEAGHEPVSIRSKAGLTSAIAEIDSLLGRTRRSKIESERLDQLSDAVREYERKHFPVKPRTPGERLRYLIDLHDTTTQQLAAKTGIKRSVLENVLSETGSLEAADANVLADHFSLEPTAFLSA